MSKEVQKRIEKALKNKAKKLYISDCDFMVLPKELKSLTLLEELRLDGNKNLRDLSPLANLQNESVQKSVSKLKSNN